MNNDKDPVPNDWYSKLLDAISCSANLTQESIKVEIQARHGELWKQINNQSVCIINLEQKLSKVETRCIELERKLRRYNIIIFGIQNAPNDTLSLL